jgi:hypothetical protein
MPGGLIGYSMHSILAESRWLPIAGDKTGNDRWYDTFVPLADRIYSLHLEQLRKEGDV